MTDIKYPEFILLQDSLPYEKLLKGWTNVGSISSIMNRITPSLLAELFRSIEDKKLRVHAVIMDARVYADLRRWEKDILTIETEADLVHQGMMAYLWGSLVFVNKKMPPNTIVALSEDKYLVLSAVEIKVKANAENEHLVNLYDTLNQDIAQVKSLLSNITKVSEELFSKLDNK